MIQYDDNYFMKKALEQAEIAFEQGEVPVGVVIVSGNRIIAKGYNLTEKLMDVTAHAEMQAITSAASFLGGKFLKNCTMYVTLEPCPMCAGALYWSQISRLVFGARDHERGYQAIGGRLHPKTEVSSGVMEKDCSLILQKFFRIKRKN